MADISENIVGIVPMIPMVSDGGSATACVDTCVDSDDSSIGCYDSPPSNSDE